MDKKITEISLNDINEEIKRSYDQDSPIESIKKICSIWEAIDKSEELIQARLNLLIAQVDHPPLQNSGPKWFNAFKLNNVSHNQLHTISNILKLHPEMNRQGSVYQILKEVWMITWDDLDIKWAVEPIKAEWPIIKICQLISNDGKPGSNTRMIFSAWDALREFKRSLIRYHQRT